MQVADRAEKLDQFPKALVRVHLFQAGLGEPLRILDIFGVRAAEDSIALMQRPLGFDEQPPLLILVEGQLVFPKSVLIAMPDPHSTHDVGVSSCSETPQSGYSATPPHRFLKAPSDGNDIAQETESIEEIRLARGIRPDEKDPQRQRGKPQG